MIKPVYGVNPNILDLKFVEGYCNKRVTYRFLIDEALFQYRQKNKSDLLSWMKNKEVSQDTIEFIEEISEFVKEKKVEEMNSNDQPPQINEPLDADLLNIIKMTYAYINFREKEKELKYMLLNRN